MARFISEAAAAAHRAHQAGASCAGSLAAHRLCYWHRPNWALQGTLIRRIASAMPSARP
jgi:hypothetical protein